MAVHVYLGDNGVGKTRYLKDIERKYSVDYKVISNFDILSTSGLLDYKKIEEMENGIAPFDSFNSRIWNIRVKSVLLNNILRLLLLEGDILILDEIDSFISKKNMLRICSILRDIEHLWVDVYISGHDINLVNASNNPIIYIWLKNSDRICTDIFNVMNYVHLL